MDTILVKKVPSNTLFQKYFTKLMLDFLKELEKIYSSNKDQQVYDNVPSIFESFLNSKDSSIDFDVFYKNFDVVSYSWFDDLLVKSKIGCKADPKFKEFASTQFKKFFKYLNEVSSDYKFSSELQSNNRVSFPLKCYEFKSNNDIRVLQDPSFYSNLHKIRRG